jgi:carbonic anhydrase
LETPWEGLAPLNNHLLPQSGLQGRLCGVPEIIAVTKSADILEIYRDTPIAHLLEYHNLNQEFERFEKAELLVGMCMDNRKQLRLPDNFAYVLRTSGANMRHNEFRVSYAIGVGGVNHIALVAHTNCGMVKLSGKYNAFVRGMIDVAGWDEQRAKDYFFQYAPFFEIEDEVEFVLLEAQRLRDRYPKVKVVPLLYKVEDGLLYQIAP